MRLTCCSVRAGPPLIAALMGSVGPGSDAKTTATCTTMTCRTTKQQRLLKFGSAHRNWSGGAHLLTLRLFERGPSQQSMLILFFTSLHLTQTLLRDGRAGSLREETASGHDDLDQDRRVGAGRDCRSAAVAVSTGRIIIQVSGASWRMRRFWLGARLRALANDALGTLSSGRRSLPRKTLLRRSSR